MDNKLLKLECLKLSRTHLGPKEAIAQADEYFKYITGQVNPSLQPDNSIPLPPKMNEPGDTGKDQK